MRLAASRICRHHHDCLHGVLEGAAGGIDKGINVFEKWKTSIEGDKRQRAGRASSIACSIGRALSNRGDRAMQGCHFCSQWRVKASRGGGRGALLMTSFKLAKCTLVALKPRLDDQ